MIYSRYWAIVLSSKAANTGILYDHARLRQR
jgi:hypothetical protein